MTHIEKLFVYRTLAESLFSKIKVTNGCWFWTGTITKYGYGVIHRKIKVNGKTIHFAHRVMEELFSGQIPPGLQVDHICRVRHCVKPTHLRVVTVRENALNKDGIHKNHCVNGHPLTTDNLQITARPRTGYPVRRCLICVRRGYKNQAMKRKSQRKLAKEQRERN